MATSTRKYYPGITLFKVIGAVMVVSGHIKKPDLYIHLESNINGLAQFMSVIIPCFYVAAGFLAYQGWSHAAQPTQYVKKYLSWIIGLYFVVFLMSIPMRFLPLLIRTGITPHSILKMTVSAIYAFFISGALYSFWFIPPLIAGIAVSYYFDRQGKLKYACILATIGFLLAQTLYGTIRAIIDVTLGDLSLFHIKHVAIYQTLLYNFAGRGSIFVLVGVVLSKHSQWFLKINGYKLSLFAITVTLLEAICLNYFIDGHLRYGLVINILPLSIWMFYSLLKIKNNKIKVYHTQLNMFSIVTYFSHYIFIRLNLYLLGWSFGALNGAQAVTCFLLSLTESILLTALILTLKKKKTPPASVISQTAK